MEELTWLEIGQRFREAREAARLSQEQLGARVELDRTMIAKIEAGNRRVDAVELVKLSGALGLPLAHFLTPQPAVISRRAHLAEGQGTKPGQAAYFLDAALSSWLRDVRQLVNAGLLKPPTPLTYPGRTASDDDARLAARWLRARLDLGDAELGLFIAVAERAGVLISLTDLEGEGAALVDDELAVAVVSTTGDHGRRRSTAAHELGHLILGDPYSRDLGVNASREETESMVDAFAAEFLLPEAVLRGQGELERAALIEIAAKYRVSWSLAVNQAVRVERVDRSTARRWKASAPTRAEFSEALGWIPQPDLEGIRVPPSYKQAVMGAFRRGDVTSGRAAEMTRGELTEEDFPTPDFEDGPL